MCGLWSGHSSIFFEQTYVWESFALIVVGKSVIIITSVSSSRSESIFLVGSTFFFEEEYMLFGVVGGGRGSSTRDGYCPHNVHKAKYFGEI